MIPGLRCQLLMACDLVISMTGTTPYGHHSSLLHGLQRTPLHRLWRDGSKARLLMQWYLILSSLSKHSSEVREIWTTDCRQVGAWAEVSITIQNTKDYKTVKRNYSYRETLVIACLDPVTSIIKALYTNHDNENKTMLSDQQSFSKKQFMLINEMILGLCSKNIVTVVHYLSSSMKKKF